MCTITSFLGRGNLVIYKIYPFIIGNFFLIGENRNEGVSFLVLESVEHIISM